MSASDDWIKHDGGPCPVRREALVDVEFMYGSIVTAKKAGRWDWGESGAGAIVAYRVVQP